MANDLVRVDPDEPLKLKGSFISEVGYVNSVGFPKSTILVALLAWATSMGLAFMLGRASVTPATPNPSPNLQAPPEAFQSAIAPMVPAAPPQSTEPKEKILYPRFVGTIPAPFQGAWDEIVTDKCFGREARYTLTATTFDNFEVETNVERAKIIGPNEIEISITGYYENKNQFNDKIGFKLVDSGKSLTGVTPGSNFYRRCPKQ